MTGVVIIDSWNGSSSVWQETKRDMRWHRKRRSDGFCYFQLVLVKSREQVADELSRLQRDNESLQGKHRLHMELQLQEDFQMPNTVQVCETQILILTEAGMSIEPLGLLTTEQTVPVVLLPVYCGCPAKTDSIFNSN